MIKKLFVDDIRDAQDSSWTVIRNAKDAVNFLFTHKVSYLSLDHDLGDDSFSGYWVACQIESRVYYDGSYVPPHITVHSANPVGRRNIEMCVATINKMLADRVAVV